MTGLRWTEEDFERHARRHADLYRARGIVAPASSRPTPSVSPSTPSTAAGRFQPFVRAVVAAGHPHPRWAGHSDGELAFAAEHGRRFRFDFAWPGEMLAVEVDGEVHRIRQRHRSDIVKLRLAALLGWTVLHFRPADVTDPDGGPGAETVVAYLGDGPAAALGVALRRWPARPG